jgi:tetratricopeptide (TPR) repeat protein
MVGALLEAANRAERAATPTLACVPWTFLARIVGLIGLHAAADRYFRMARRRAEQAGDLTAVLRCHQSEAFYLHNAGQLDRAAAVVAAGLALCSGSASHYEQSALELVQAFVLIAQGDLRAAETVLTRVAQTSATYGNRFHEAQARKLLGVCAIESGHFEDARHTCLRLAQDARAAGNQLDWLNLSALACAALWRGGRPQLARPLAIELARESTRSAQLFHLFELQAYLPEILVGIWRTEPGDRELRALTRLSCRAAHKCARVFKVLQPAAWRALGCARAVAGDRRVAVRDLHRSLTLAQAYQMPVEAAVTSLELLRLQAVAADRTAAVAAEARETLRRTGAAYPHLLAALPGGDSGGGTISRE